MKWQISMDDAGRVVIPKPVRNALHLRGGTQLSLSVDQDKMLLEPTLNSAGCLARREGVLVLEGELEGPLSTVDTVRERRTQDILGFSNPK